MTAADRSRANLVTAIAAGATFAQAAAAAGVSERTARRRWHADPDMRAEVRELQEEAARATTYGLTQLATRATERLAELLDSDNDNVALRAVALTLDAAARHDTNLDVLERLAELELAADAGTLRAVR